MKLEKQACMLALAAILLLIVGAFVVGFPSEKYTWHKSQGGNKIGKDEYRRRCQDG